MAESHARSLGAVREALDAQAAAQASSYTTPRCYTTALLRTIYLYYLTLVFNNTSEALDTQAFSYTTTLLYYVLLYCYTANSYNDLLIH